MNLFLNHPSLRYILVRWVIRDCPGDPGDGLSEKAYMAVFIENHFETSRGKTAYTRFVLVQLPLLVCNEMNPVFTTDPRQAEVFNQPARRKGGHY
jgi:hypothetical protein